MKFDQLDPQPCLLPQANAETCRTQALPVQEGARRVYDAAVEALAMQGNLLDEGDGVVPALKEQHQLLQNTLVNTKDVLRGFKS